MDEGSVTADYLKVVRWLACDSGKRFKKGRYMGPEAWPSS